VRIRGAACRSAGIPGRNHHFRGAAPVDPRHAGRPIIASRGWRIGRHPPPPSRRPKKRHEPISVAFVEDDARTRERFANVIGAEPTLRFAFSASTATELLAWFADNAVDVLLVDLGLPDMSGLEVIRRCSRMQPACSVMVITIVGDEANMLRAFEAGAQGYLLKDGTSPTWPPMCAACMPAARR
jgi:CheY-like chemotaxis protein